MKSNVIKLCTFDKNASCNECINKGEISCKPDPNKVIISHYLEFSFIFMSTLGVGIISILLRIWWPVVMFIAYIALFILVIQSRITCSHCPYYAESRRILHCSENHFTPKLWRYHPEPINKWEKAGTFVGFGFLGGFPLLIDLYGLWVFSQGTGNLVSIFGFSSIFLGTLFTLGAFFLTFYFLNCPHCVNFSCIFNKVPERNVREYLRRNPVMRKAWEKHGRKYF